MTKITYTLSEIENIIWNIKEHQLPDETIKIINTISQQVGAPNYVKTPHFPNKNNSCNKLNKKRKNIEEVSSDSWECVRSFQKTEITKKEGIEKEIDSIRLLINKLAEKTYDKISESIISTLNDIKENNEYDDESINKIGYTIFNMATKNKFNSNIYSRLCSKLLSKFDFMNGIINNNIVEFMKLFDNMVFVSPEDNYDEFCEMNINNEKRRAMTLFITNLYKNNVITLDVVFENIINIQTILMNNINESSKKMENEELSENLYIFVTNIPLLIVKRHSKWNNINDNIQIIKNIDCKTNLGISAKSKFKHMDINDKLKE